MTSRPIPVLTQKDIDRFWMKVNRGDKCWEWLASKCGTGYNKGLGYGQFGKGRNTWYAHRVSWVIAYGEIPEGLYVCHHCDNQSCVRPDHLFLGTALENTRDCFAKGREARGIAKANFGDKNGMRKPGVYEKFISIVRSPEFRQTMSVAVRKWKQEKKQGMVAS